MKKLGLFMLAGALTIGLSACGGTKEEAKTTDSDNTEAVETTTTSGVEEFTITATNWDFASDKELVIKAGTKVKLNLVNKEGFHTLSNDELGFDLGADSPVEFTAETAGEYELICSTVCGSTDDHEAMVITLKVID